MPSSVIEHFHYNEESKVLTIIFVAGLVYHYQKVQPETYQMLKISGSKGRYFNYFIKDRFKWVKEE